MQRYAAELSGLSKEESQDDHTRALSEEQQIERAREFRKWIDYYPNKMFGDPDSKFWKWVKVDVVWCFHHHRHVVNQTVGYTPVKGDFSFVYLHNLLQIYVAQNGMFLKI